VECETILHAHIGPTFMTDVLTEENLSVESFCNYTKVYLACEYYLSNLNASSLPSVMYLKQKYGSSDRIIVVGLWF
jgi:hypothetical protein